MWRRTCENETARSGCRSARLAWYGTRRIRNIGRRWSTAAATSCRADTCWWCCGRRNRASRAIKGWAAPKWISTCCRRRNSFSTGIRSSRFTPSARRTRTHHDGWGKSGPSKPASSTSDWVFCSRMRASPSSKLSLDGNHGWRRGAG